MSGSNTLYINPQGNLKRTDTEKPFGMIDNYIYLYHLQKLVIIPTYPENFQDQMSVQYSPNNVLSRSAPIFAYSSSGPRSITFQIKLQRELMDIVNTQVPGGSIVNIPEDMDYVDYIIRNLQAMAVPRYDSSQKMVDPPLIAVRFGADIFCKGVVSGSVTVGYELPILGKSRDGSITRYNNKYSLVNIGFTVQEITPYGAEEVANMGGYRMDTDLERMILT